LTMSGWVRFDEEQLSRTGWFGQNDAVEFGMIEAESMMWWSPKGSVQTELGPWVEEWTHVAVVLGDGTISTYVNGEETNTVGGGGPVSSGYSFNIGGGGIWDAAGNYFYGELDDIAVWDVALTAVEIKKIAEGLSPLAEVPPAVAVVKNADGSLTITFDGTLQTAPTVNGPWTDVNGESPLQITADGEAWFGRARK
jgi:hypothetical protein